MKTKTGKIARKSSERHVRYGKFKKKKLEIAEKNKIKNIAQKNKTVLKKDKLISKKTNNLKRNFQKEGKIANTKNSRQISSKEISNNNISQQNFLVKPVNQNKQKQKAEKRKLKRKKQKAQKQQNIENNESRKPLINSQNKMQEKREKLKEKLQQTLNNTENSTIPKSKQPPKSLRARMLDKLKAARFRYINEHIYSSDSKETQKLFSSDPESFHAYHEGYRLQVNKWPLNPVDIIIQSIQLMPQTHIVADFGCGEASLAKSVQQKVHSFDLVAKNEFVTACDMARVPLPKASVDVAVFCLSLMGTNLKDYLLEANRVLKEGGILKMAEVESRFENINQFIQALKKFNFKLTWKDLSHNLFYFLDFKKEANIKNKKNLPSLSLNPCLYKKR